MKRKLRRVRGGFVPRTPFYKNYRTGARTTNFRTAVTPAQRRKPMSIPLFRGTSRVKGLGTATETQPKIAPPNLKKQVSTQTQMVRTRRRGFKYLPAIYRKKPRYPMSRRPKSAMMSRVKPTGEGATRSYFSNGKRNRRKRYGVSQMTPLQTRIYNQCNRFTSVAGRQAFFRIDTLINTDLDILMAAMPLTTGFPANTRSLYIQSVVSKTMFSNTAATNVFVDIYNIQPRKDITETSTNAFSLGITDMLAGTTAQTLGLTPYMSQRFTKAYTIRKVTRIELAAGRTHLHTTKYNISRPYTQSDDIAYGTDEYRKDYSFGILCIAYSEPINTVDGSTVTTAPVSVNTFTTETYKFNFGDTLTKDIFVSDLSAGQINTAGLQLYDEGSGAVEPFSAA